ncbi:MAG: hypothetical protein JNJ83_03190 [Verrucomicrobiaceae bacterium]|nr:hypothetical protein [Verrucomicrobiaceae bacterium]
MISQAFRATTALLLVLLSACQSSSVEEDLALVGGFDPKTGALPTTVGQSPQIENIPPPDTGDPLIGRWFTRGADCQPPLDYDALVVRRADGYYTCDFNYGTEGRRVFAEGRWTRTGNIYKVQTLKSGDSYLSPKDPMHLIEYKVEKADQAEVWYRSEKTNKLFKTKRVDDSFVLPTYSSGS